ncbi:MAG: RagB/SusD family nutrient uptake outer membrane protein [Bacteroidales bacterium]|nr:RagB/SusD family nutrient uptake outer membrane protein [Bacteroidales bacterium]
MKYKSILSLFIFLLGFGVSTTSCEDMLTPDMDRYSENFSGNDTVYFYLGILRNVQDMVEQNELLGDLRSDLVTTTSYSSDSIADIINYQKLQDGENGLLNRAAYYKVINQCNFYLAKVDTNAVKNNIYYMRKEYAQVVAIRAWTYLQLVQTYGRVPFITKPVDNANTGWENNPETWATPDNLVDLLKDELEKAKTFEHTLGAPNYGSFNTGNITIDSKYMRFYNDLVLGDLYLLRGKDRADFVAAAKNYYYFLKEKAKSGISVLDTPARFNEFSMGGKDYYSPSISSWISAGLQATSLSSYENITIIPSAANSSFGKVLSREAQIYGFDIHSTNSTTGGDDNATDATTSGNISVKPNLRSRQIAPSEAYLNLCAAQYYTNSVFTSASELPTEVEYYEGVGDARMHATAPIFQTTDGKERYIVKNTPVTSVSMDGQANAASFKYYKSLYRLSQVYLRYAEAINRAGYPRTAFAILRDGINFNNMPKLLEDKVYDDENQTWHYTYDLDSVKTAYGINYIGADELYRAQNEPEYANFIDFSTNIWNNKSIHGLGCGTSTVADTLYDFECAEGIVRQRIQQEQALANALGLSLSETPDTPAEEVQPQSRANDDEEGEETEPDRSGYKEGEPARVPAEVDMNEVLAVESLIADELALQTAYEGTRMFDLIRIARHRDAAGQFGTQWLAWKVARRNELLKPYEVPTQYNATLYNLLVNPENWYIANPQY